MKPHTEQENTEHGQDESQSHRPSPQYPRTPSLIPTPAQRVRVLSAMAGHDEQTCKLIIDTKHIADDMAMVWRQHEETRPRGSSKAERQAREWSAAWDTLDAITSAAEALSRDESGKVQPQRFRDAKALLRAFLQRNQWGHT